MSLFSINDIGSGATATRKYATRSDESPSACFTAECRCALSDALGAIEASVHIASCGAFSMHQMAFYIAGVIGRAKLYATTWAINEEVVAMLLRAQQEGLLQEVNFLFDWRVRKYKPNAYALAAQHFTTHVVSLHAKVCVLESERRSVAVVGSANWTRNSKIEAYYLSVDREVANFWKNFINEQLHRRATPGS
jgi:hypothetical protein